MPVRNGEPNVACIAFAGGDPMIAIYSDDKKNSFVLPRALVVRLHRKLGEAIEAVDKQRDVDRDRAARERIT